jgi:NADH dehydrogenase (ubiquinone) 1 alpha subcomplex subunit 9
VWPSTWKLNHEQTILRPVHVLDVARALARLSSMPPVPKTISLPGPQAYSIEYLLELVSSVTYRPASRSPHLPKPIAKLFSRVSGLVWWPALSQDQVERRYIDDASIEGDWDVFDFTPDALEEHALTYLQMYRSS